MDELRDLYQEVILDHGKAPHNFGDLEGATCEAKGHNPLCGDQLVVYLIVKDGIVEDVKFKGSGCAISTASASLMTDAVKGKKIEEAHAIFENFHQMLTNDDAVVDEDKLGKLVVLAGVKDFPVRVKCATLAWHTLDAALKNQHEATTE